MILNDILGHEAWDSAGVRVGRVIDARFVLDGSPGPLLADAVLHGLIISPRSHSSFWGYERSAVNAPWLIATLLTWRHRGTFLVEWDDVRMVGTDAVHLRDGYRRLSPAL